MTLDSNIILPLHTDRLSSDNPEERETYVRELVFSIQGMYEDIADTVNGNIGSDQEVGGKKFTPTVTGTSGTNGSETYQRQTGWYFRQGLVVDVWIDVAFTGHAATGNTQISLPYTSASTANNPFHGTLVTSSIAYTLNYTQISWNIGTNSLVADVLESGSGQALQSLSMAATASFRGHIRYIGKRND